MNCGVCGMTLDRETRRCPGGVTACLYRFGIWTRHNFGRGAGHFWRTPFPGRRLTLFDPFLPGRATRRRAEARILGVNFDHIVFDEADWST